MKKVTIYDVANAANISFKSVSRALNGESGISKERATYVLAVAKQLGYVPNLAARRLAGNRTNTIALAFLGDMDSYIVDLQLGILDACGSLQYELIIHPCVGSSNKAGEQLVRIANQRRVDGLIITPPLCDNHVLVSSLEGLVSNYVLISPKSHDRGMLVYFDEYQAAYDVTTRLISYGHTRIGFIKGNPSHSSSKSRYAGYKGALRDANLPIDHSIVAPGKYSFHSGKEGARHILNTPNPPTAIFASDDDTAVGAIHYAHEAHIRVPDQLSIIGFDDVPIAQSVWPTLTTVRQPIKTMGHEAAKMLISSIRNKHGNNTHVSATILEYEIIERNSTKKRK